MSERRVTLWGDMVGRYIVRESDPSGRVTLEPDPQPAAQEEPSFVSRVEQAAGQGRASLDGLLATTVNLTEEQAVELGLLAGRKQEVALAMSRHMRVEHRAVAGRAIGRPAAAEIPAFVQRWCRNLPPAFVAAEAA